MGSERDGWRDGSVPNDLVVSAEMADRIKREVEPKSGTLILKHMMKETSEGHFACLDCQVTAFLAHDEAGGPKIVWEVNDGGYRQTDDQPDCRTTVPALRVPTSEEVNDLYSKMKWPEPSPDETPMNRSERRAWNRTHGARKSFWSKGRKIQ